MLCFGGLLQAAVKVSTIVEIRKMLSLLLLVPFQGTIVCSAFPRHNYREGESHHSNISAWKVLEELENKDLEE